MPVEDNATPPNTPQIYPRMFTPSLVMVSGWDMAQRDHDSGVPGKAVHVGLVDGVWG